MKLNLVCGSGSLERNEACWMSYVNFMLEWGKKGFRWTDKVKCVDPVINTLCIQANDYLSDEARTRVIFPHRFAPVGTKQGSDLTIQRAFRVVDVALRTWLPDDLERLGFKNQSEKFRGLDAIVNLRSANQSIRAALTARANLTDLTDLTDRADRAALTARAVHAVHAALAARAVLSARVDLETLAELTNLAFLADRAACAVLFEHVDRAVFVALVDEHVEYRLIPLILELCAMGREEREHVATEDDLERAFAKAKK